MRSWAMLLGLLAACAAEEDRLVVDLGVITTPFEADFGQSIRHPATAQAGVDVEITALTFGDDCTSARRTDVEVTGLEVVIRPFDQSWVDSFCGDIALYYLHPIDVRFEQAGTATIRVLGYEEHDRFGTVIERSSTLEVR